MKKILNLLILNLIIVKTCTAQKEYWGMFTLTDTTFFNSEKGCIYKVDSAGQNFSIVHKFDSIHGMNPAGRLFHASNGKLYGTTGFGGTFATPFTTGGTLFEYDLSIDSLTVIVNFATSQYPLGANPSASFVEMANSLLYGIVQSGSGPGSIFKFDTTIDSITNFFQFPMLPYQGNTIPNTALNNLMLAANGNLYGATINGGVSGCAPYSGTIFKIDTATNAVTTVHTIGCSPQVLGTNPLGDLVEYASNKLYGRTIFGGANNGGVLFEYDYLANTYTVKHHFDSLEGNSYNITLSAGFNNKFYGLTTGGGTDALGAHFGTLYEYDPITNIYATKHNFGFQNDGQGGYILTGIFPQGRLLPASNGKLYGHNFNGVFEYDLALDTLILTTVFPNPGNISNPVMPAAGLIEICRKPSYKYFYTDTFTVCINHTFYYTVHSKNATTYQWNFNGNAIPTQTDSILNFNSIQLADSGTYTCTMQNQCGQTTTMNLVIKVSTCSGIDEQFGIENAIAISPNPAHEEIVLQIQSTNINTIKQVQLKNALGQTVLQDASGNRKMNVEYLAKGIYIVEVGTDKGLWVGRFVKY